MILFNWDAVVRKADYNAYRVLDVFKEINTKGVPRKLAGNSFLLNLRDVLTCNASLEDKFDYIALAALRNYFDFEYLGNAGLFKYFSPAPLDKLSRNRLLTIKHDYIYFTFEERRWD